jgi:hypothetical protein
MRFGRRQPSGFIAPFDEVFADTGPGDYRVTDLFFPILGPNSEKYSIRDSR